MRRYAELLTSAKSDPHQVFQRFRPRKTRVRKPLFCEDICEAAAGHKITSRPSEEKFYCTIWLSLSSNPPYAGFLFLSAAQAGIAEFERELTQNRIGSDIAAAKARGKRLGRQPGQRPKSDRLVPQVLALVAKGRSYRLIEREVGLSKNTVADIIKRHHTKAPLVA